MQIGYALPNVLGREITAVIDQPSDGVLIEAIAEGEKGAMRVLFARHNVRVFRFIVGLTRDESLADDLVSEVFLEVWRKASQFEGRSTVSTWLLAIARHKTYSAFKHRTDAQLDEHFAQTIEDPTDGPGSVLDKKDRSAVLAHCLTKLSPAHREIIDLVYYHEKSIEEVAEITGFLRPPSRPACITRASGWRNCSRRPGSSTFAMLKARLYVGGGTCRLAGSAIHDDGCNPGPAAAAPFPSEQPELLSGACASPIFGRTGGVWS